MNWDRSEFHSQLQRDVDAKTAQMLEIYASGRYDRPRSAALLRLRLISWVIRSKIKSQAKRGFDIVLSALLLVPAAPIMALTALAIRLDSPGPVIFGQQRVGRWGRPFTCYKFRSMYHDAEERKQALLALNEADGPIFKMRADPRVTRVGRVIRKLSIDELPQLWNILKGDMSLVGPRPPVPEEVREYDFATFGRLEAVPGLTGLQQVSGRSDLGFQRWVELDLQYIAEQSLMKDVEILLRTIPTVLLGRGAY